MHAALVTSFNQPPRYTTVDAPAPTSPTEVVVDVVASALHPRVRSQSDGSHYTSTEELPLIPGIDGVGRSPDGELRYFVLPDTTQGALADQTVIDLRRSIPMNDDVDPLLIAAGMNPAMSSWLALRKRVDFQPGQSVLVLGATGSAGRLAVQVAKHFGASRVVAAGRDADRLADLRDLGADSLVSLAGSDDEVSRGLADAAADVDVVLDYLWGAPTALAMAAIVTARPDRGRPLTWIEIGSVAGATAPIPSAALRAAALNIVGSGQGSVSAREILAELPALVAAITDGVFAIDARAVSLTQVEATWTAAETGGQRVVFTP